MCCFPRVRKAMSKSTRSYGYERLDSVPPTPRMAPAPTPVLGAAGAGAGAGPSAVHLSTQHERLILELLPFKDATKFHEWLQGPYVRGPWREFCLDFLSKSPAAVPEPDKARTAQLARDAINSRNAKFLVYFPDKEGWTAEDHHVRFIVAIVLDNMLKGLWSESEWKKRGLDVAKAVYEVLSYLRSSFYVQNPPGYSA